MYIIVPSYPSLFFAIDSFSKNNDTVIITSNHGVNRIARDLDIPCIFIDVYRSIWTRLIMRFSLYRLFQGLDKRNELFLCDDIYCIEGFYLISRWKISRKYFVNLSPQHSNFTEFLSIFDVVKITIFRIVWGFDLCYKNVNDRPVIGVDMKYLRKNNVLTYNISDYNRLRHQVAEKFNRILVSCDDLLVMQGDLTGIVTNDSLEKLYVQLNKSSSFYIKYHPKFHQSYLFDTQQEIPSYIPVELCLNGVNRAVISIYSTALITASCYPHLVAISLLDLVDWNNMAYKEKVRNWLRKESNDRIKFVQSLQEVWV